MLIVHAADIHLDAPLKGRRVQSDEAHNEVRLATRHAFINLIDLCIQEEATLLLLAGDLFDGATEDFNTGLFAHRQLARLRDVGTRVVVVKGNHDAEHMVRNTLLDASSPHVRVLDHKKPQQVLYEDIGVAVAGQSYALRHVESNLALSFPEPLPGLLNIGILHTDASGAAGQYGYAPCTQADLVGKRYDYWALGHIHKRTVLYERDPLILYPGNTQGRHINETGSKGCSLVRFDDGGITSVEEHPLDAVRWDHVQVSAQPDDRYVDVMERVERRLQDCRQELDRERCKGHPLIARISVSGATGAHHHLMRNPGKTAADLTAAASQWDIWPERIIVDTEPARSDTPEHLGDFLHALDAAFERLITGGGNLQPYRDLLQPLQDFASKHTLEHKPADMARTRALLGEARSLLLANLRAGSDGIDNEMD